MLGKHHSEVCKRIMSLAKDSIKRAIIQINIKTGEIKEYESFISAVKDGFNQGNIWKCGNNKQETHKGFYWEFLNV